MKVLRQLILGCMTIAIFAASTASAAPLGTGFTYQGQLNQAGSPVTGTAHFRFSLWNAVAGGTQIGVDQIVPNVLVTGGIFMVQLNAGDQFSAEAFNGDARWLEVEVCTDAVCTSQTLLTPRQPLTGTPYALESIQTQKLSNLSGGVAFQLNPASVLNAPGLLAGKAAKDLLIGSYLEPSGDSHGFLSTGFASASSARKISLGRASLSDFSTATYQPLLTVVSNSGNVGVGTSTPAFPLSFPNTLGQKISIYSNAAGGVNYGLGVQPGLFQIHADDPGADIGFGTGSSASFTERVRFKGSGDVGIGTTAPTAKLDVRGNIKLGSSGAEFAASGSENLRIIRGSVNGCGTGTIQYGSGFTLAPGCTTNFIRTITFNTPFSSPPTVTATATDCVGCNTAFCEIVSVSTTEVRISQYYRHDGSYVGGPFNFIAIGPR